MIKSVLIAALLTITTSALSQIRTLTPEEAVGEALRNSLTLVSSRQAMEARKQMHRTSVDLPKTEISLLYGQYNSYADDNNISITQSIPFSAFGSQGGLNRAQSAASERYNSMRENELAFEVKRTYYSLAHAKAVRNFYRSQDSLYVGFEKSATLRYQSGESNLLEQNTAKTQRSEASVRLRRSEAEITNLQLQLQSLINITETPDVSLDGSTPLPFPEVLDSTAVNDNPALAYLHQQVEVAHREKKVNGAKLAPDLLIGFFTQTLVNTPNFETGSLATSSDRFTGFQVGMAIPLWFVPHEARIKASDYNRQSAQSNLDHEKLMLHSELAQAVEQMKTHRENMRHYTEGALDNASMILRQSQIAYREGEIGYAEYLIGLQNAAMIRQNYLATVHDYNQSVIYYEYLTGKK